MIFGHRFVPFPAMQICCLAIANCLDEATKHQIYTDIYDDSEWLIGVVENLLSITRLNDGRLKFKFTDQLLDEVIAEALRHISRKHDDYKIVTDCEELVLARMDVQSYYAGFDKFSR